MPPWNRVLVLFMFVWLFDFGYRMFTSYINLGDLTFLDAAAATHPTASSNSTTCTTSNSTTTTHAISPNRKRPYGAYCDTEVLGEKQIGNDRKRVISYSLFSEPTGQPLDQWFKVGTEQNIKDAKLYFPDWIVRIHITALSQADQEWLLQVSDNVELVNCPAGSVLDKTKSRRMISRFLVYDDPTVEYTIVRDLDSRLSPRELLAVHEWIGSPYAFHVMRDHEQHTVAVMGGMFGMKRGVLDHAKQQQQQPTTTSTMTDLVQRALPTQNANPFSSACCGEDQAFLKQLVWPIVKGTTMDHDITPSRCQNFGSAACRPFIIQQPGLHVGQDIKEKSYKQLHRFEFTCHANPIPMSP